MGGCESLRLEERRSMGHWAFQWDSRDPHGYIKGV